MSRWNAPDRNVGLGGWFQIVITKPGHKGVDVTFFRRVPTSLDSYSNADPFGDSAATITFPQLTGFDDPDAADLHQWFGLFANVDIFWVPGVHHVALDVLPPPKQWIDPLTNQPDIQAPRPYTALLSNIYTDNRVKLWEGFVASIDITASDTGHSVQLSCQGALFQLDRYLQKPQYPKQPIPLEDILMDVFDHHKKPHLRTKRMSIEWPDGWNRTIPRRSSSDNPALVIAGKAGKKWTGFASRQTGSWERCLTGYCQDTLSLMVVRHGDGGPTGSQWTINQQRASWSESHGYRAGRVPVLLVRSNNRPSDFSVWLGTPGITGTFSRDGTQFANIVYGDGTSIDGTTWRNSVISNNGRNTDYMPLAWIKDVYPYTRDNKKFNGNDFASEAYMQFGAGFNQEQATRSAEATLQRDRDSGYTGSLSFEVDPSENMSRWQIQAGMTVKVKGLIGTQGDGVNFHITEVNASPQNGTVDITIDSKYRDLLTVEEARARNRDPLTPTRMLQANRTTVLIEDKLAPWDYHAGSGYIPRESKKMWDSKGRKERFPYTDMIKNHPPKTHGHWYVRVNANDPDRKKRWTRVPILTSERGTIRRTEIYCVDKHGNILKNPFHFSIYYGRVTQMAMPHDSKGPSAYINNAFQTIDPVTGEPEQTSALLPDNTLIDGALWGAQINHVFNRAGFYPGSEVQGSPPSGILIDENTWDFDNTNNPNWDPNAHTVHQELHHHRRAITVYGMFYAEYTEPVYFFGRLYRQNPGTE